MRLYHMNEQLAYIVDQIDAMKEGSDGAMDKDLDKKLKNTLKQFSNDLVDIKDPLVITSGDNYVGAAEPQLREKIADLYGTVAGYAGRPSNAQLQSIEDLDNRLQEVQEQINKMIPRLQKINESLEKAEMPKITFKSKEDFTRA